MAQDTRQTVILPAQPGWSVISFWWNDEEDGDVEMDSDPVIAWVVTTQITADGGALPYQWVYPVTAFGTADLNATLTGPDQFIRCLREETIYKTLDAARAAWIEENPRHPRPKLEVA